MQCSAKRFRKKRIHIFNRFSIFTFQKFSKHFIIIRSMLRMDECRSMSSLANSRDSDSPELLRKGLVIIECIDKILFRNCFSASSKICLMSIDFFGNTRNGNSGPLLKFMGESFEKELCRKFVYILFEIFFF